MSKRVIEYERKIYHCDKCIALWKDYNTYSRLQQKCPTCKQAKYPITKVS